MQGPTKDKSTDFGMLAILGIYRPKLVFRPNTYNQVQILILALSLLFKIKTVKKKKKEFALSLNELSACFCCPVGIWYIW